MSISLCVTVWGKRWLMKMRKERGNRMKIKECATQQLRAEFPLMFAEKQPVSIRLAEIQKAEELLDRDNRTDPAGVAEMKRQLEALSEALKTQLPITPLTKHRPTATRLPIP
jgi:hypothetical protein